MRYSERELLSLARQPAEKAAEILMRVPKKGSVLKKRLVKLVVNFLFYFRTDEAEPIGALLLEHCKITKEEENVFSISFIEEPDRKYSFECDTEEQCQEWIEALRRASYEFMRRSLIFYRNEIQKMTGKILKHSGVKVATVGFQSDNESSYASKITCSRNPLTRQLQQHRQGLTFVGKGSHIQAKALTATKALNVATEYYWIPST
ncbi:pleckstrin homology domain-containing family J member 1 isoform X2 [Gopherus evgoodei]|uniref:Sesquipedalian n=1 Tax=Gopherus evgoodei TaxID=1825980 RepID=A0A8C4WD40_9SAUR|nr:pleckstrin homology domain-containing family J member 1 isoform X2 [Gopherus evgoodei]